MIMMMILLQVIFEGIVGNSYTGDIAIDNIHFVKGTCNGEPVPEEKETENKGNEKN